MERRELQRVELDILKQFIELCEANGLRYFALGGTELGAIRHKGFIPWDDDVDVGMPRADYERFLKLARERVKAPYALENIDNPASGYCYYYARLSDSRYEIVRSLTEKKVTIHAWIDIFPLDGTPEDEAEFRAWYKRILRLQTLFQLSQFEYYYKVSSPEGEVSNRLRGLKTAVKRCVLGTGVYKLLNTRRIWEKLDRVMRMYDYDTSAVIMNVCGHWREKERTERATFGEGALNPFEDVMLRGPKDYDRYLTKMYGDYMTPPPENQRNHHAIEAE